MVAADEVGMPLDHEKLDVYRELHGRGCGLMLSNSDTPFVHRLYAGFRVERVSCNRAINSRADARGAVFEVIVTNRF